MRVNVKEFLHDAGITEAFYPGKRIVHACRQAGDFKSHCVVLDWRNPDKIRIELKAGLSGKDLEFKKLKYYPVSFQSPTYVDIVVINDNKEDEEGEDETGKTSGGDSRGHQKKSLSELKSTISSAFGDVMKGKVPELGQITQMVVMGMQIVKEAYGAVIGKLAQQISHAKIQATDLLAQAGHFVTKYTPPAFMKPTGNEDKVYRYDREKNADIGYRPGTA